MASTWMEQIRNTALMRGFAFLRIPLLYAVRPQVLELSQNRTILKIALSRRTKNHLGVMYFGALAMGGEAAVGLVAAEVIRQSGEKIDFLFKDFSAQFLKRADGDVQFICDQTQQVRDLIEKARLSGQRENQTFQSYAIVPSRDPQVHVAEFQVTLSAKKRPSKPL